MGPTQLDYLDVMGQTDLGELYVNGSAHLALGPNGPMLGAYLEGSSTYNGEPVGPEGLLEVASPATFQNDLKVMGLLHSDYLDVMGQASLGELYVNGSAHLAWGSNGPLLGAYREGASTYNGDPVGPEGLLEVSSPATFQNDLRVMPEGTLSVEGTTTLMGPTNILGPISFGDEFQVSGTAQMDQLFVESSLNVMGPVSFENGFQVESNGPNGPMLGAYSEGSTTPYGDIAGPEGLFEVVSPAKFHNELWVMGSLSSDRAYFGELLAYKLQVVGQNGRLILGTYNDGDIVNNYIVGPEGLLEVISPATFQNDLRVMPEGTLSVEGTTTLMGPTNILGPISFGDAFQVSGTAQMDQLFVEGNLNVMGPVSFENGFQVGSNGPNGPILGAYSEGSTTPIGNIAGPEGLFEVASPALFRNELHVMESLSSWKAHFLELQADNLQVESPDGQILGAYTVGSTTFNGDEVGPEGLLEVISPATFQNNLDLTGPEGRLNVEGTTTLMGPTNILGPISFGDEFEIGGMAKMNQLRVDGPTDFQGPAFFQNGLEVVGTNAPILITHREGSSTFDGNEVGPEGLLEVISPATFQNELRVTGIESKLSVEGSAYLMGQTDFIGPARFLGEAIFENELKVTGPESRLKVEGLTELMGPTEFMGPAFFQNGLEVVGTNAPILITHREGSSTFDGNEVGPEGLLEVISPASFQNELSVTGLESKLSVEGSAYLMGQTEFMGPAFFQNGLEVAGTNAPILITHREGSSTFDGNEVGPEGLLEVISPATFQNNLDVTGPEGRLNVEGTTTLMGPTNILGPISFGDEFEIGGMAKMNQLRVDGPTDFQGPAFFQNGLEVVGTNAPILITHREGSSTFDGNEVGPEGLLEVISPATFQNELRVTGIESKLSVEGSAYLMGQTDFIGPARFLGEAIFENELKVTGPESRLKVEGLTELMGPTEFMGPAFFQNGLEVVGTNAPILITHREGSSTFDGNEVGPEGLLEVISPASFQNELSVTGLESKLSVEGSAYLMGQTEFMGPAFFQNGLEVAGTNAPILITHREGSSTFDGNEVGPEGLLEVISPATFQNNLDVTGPEGRLNVEGTTTLMGPTNILGPISFGDEFEIGGMAKMNQLRVDGPTDFQGPAFFQNGLEVVGTNAPILITHREGSSTFDGNEVGPEGLLEVISPATFQNELRVMGPLRSDYLDVMGPSSLGELYVNGSTRLGNSPDGPLFGLYPEGISHNGNEVGPEGLLEVASPATFQSNLEVMGSTTFKGLTTFEGSTTLTLAPDEQFSVSGITELNELRVMGSASIDYLDVMGPLDSIPMDQRVWPMALTAPCLAPIAKGLRPTMASPLDLRDYLKSPVQPHSKMNLELWDLQASIISMLWDLLA